MSVEAKDKPEPATIAHLVADYPNTRKIVDTILETWPEHDSYIRKGLAARSESVMRTTEELAGAALVLAGSRLPEIAVNYRWTCDRLREEELYFHRNGGYRLKTFEEADREVYSNTEYMEKYVDGLLLSQILWYNHAASCDFFMNAGRKLVPDGGSYLEIGPGHGLMMYLALRDFGLDRAVAWDLSAVSVEQTRHALTLLGFEDAKFAVQDLTKIKPGEHRFDMVVLSEVLEHLEDPIPAMRNVRQLVDEDSLVFINVPLNSPSPDHLYLMETPEDARVLLTETGFEIVEEGLFPMQNMALDRALRNKVSISVCMFARPVA